MKAASSPILTNILGALIAIMVGMVISIVSSQDMDLADHEVLPYHGTVGTDLAGMQVAVQNIHLDVVELKSLVEDIRRGTISYEGGP